MGQFKNKDITSGRRSAFEWVALQKERETKKKSEHVPSEAQLAARFKPGVSGNPGGKPLGASHKITLVKEAIAKGEGLSPGEMMMEIAARNFGKDSTAGDALALKAIIEANKYVEPSADTQAVIEASSVDDMTDEELDKEILTLVGNK
jgi:hypothetical protein